MFRAPLGSEKSCLSLARGSPEITVWVSIGFALGSIFDLVVGAQKVIGKGLNRQFTRINFGHGTHIEVMEIIP